ncbi:MAG: helix-turn-helix transcriptional regulator [Thermoleophilaceae bacterium]
MRCSRPELGELVRLARLRHGLSQRQLAVRVGTSQDAISRVERGRESPSFERFRELLLAMGEEPSLRTAALDCDLSDDDLRASLSLSPAERLRESASWNLVATRLEIAGAEARRAGHPATRPSGR